MSRATLALALACLAWAGAGTAAPPRWSCQVAVKAVDTAYTQAPVTVRVPAPAGAQSATLRQVGGGEVPCGVEFREGQAEVTWMLDQLPRGAWRRYLLKFGTAPPPRGGVTLTEGKEGVDILLDGKLFTRYRVDGPKPYCWPLMGPTGQPITRSYPMEQVAGESTDHPHHRSFWFGFGDVNDEDFWSESEEAGKIVHQAFEGLFSSPVVGRLRARSRWVAAEGKQVCQEVRELRIYRTGRGRLLDFEVTLLATEGPVVMGDTKEGMMAVRVASSMEVPRGAGHIVNSRGQRDGATWGKQAEWCDYWGPVAGQTVGIAILEHPESFRHPTYWHVRDYGLFAANPFGVHDFLGQPGQPGAYTIPAGGAITFRYRLYLHTGDEQQAGVADLYQQYAHPPLVQVH